jgi:hypothetical protein
MCDDRNGINDDACSNTCISNLDICGRLPSDASFNNPDCCIDENIPRPI